MDSFEFCSIYFSNFVHCEVFLVVATTFSGKDTQIREIFNFSSIMQEIPVGSQPTK